MWRDYWINLSPFLYFKSCITNLSSSIFSLMKVYIFRAYAHTYKCIWGICGNYTSLSLPPSPSIKNEFLFFCLWNKTFYVQLYCACRQTRREQWDLHATGMPFPGQAQAEARFISQLLNHLPRAENAMLVFHSHFEKLMGFPTLLLPVIFYTPITALHPTHPLESSHLTYSELPLLWSEAHFCPH